MMTNPRGRHLGTWQRSPCGSGYSIMTLKGVFTVTEEVLRPATTSRHEYQRVERMINRAVGHEVGLPAPYESTWEEKLMEAMADSNRKGRI